MIYFKGSKKAVLGILLLVVFLSGCGQNSKPQTSKQTIEKKDKEILVYLEEEPMDLDPLTAEDSSSIQINLNTYDTLISFDEKQNNRGLAQDYQISKDGLQYDIYLRKTKWSNGEDIKAQEVVDTYIELLAPETASKYPELLFDIVGAKDYYQGELDDKGRLGIKALDDAHIQIQLNKPSKDFLKVLADSHLSIVSKDLEVSSGPYYIKEKINNQKILLEKNPYYWDKENIYFEKIEYQIQSGKNKSLNDFLRGQVDVIKLDDTIFERVKEAERHVIYNGKLTYLMLNSQKESLADETVRAQLFSAVDTQILGEKLFAEKRKVPYHLYPSDDSIEKKENNRAVKMPIKLVGISENDPLAIKLSAALQQMIGESGVQKVDIQSLGSGSYYERLHLRDYDFCIYSYQSILGNAQDYLKNMANLLDVPYEASKTLEEIEGTLEKECLVKPISLGVDYYGIKKELEGIVYNPSGLPIFKYASRKMTDLGD